jgi:hypothetical protein
MESKEFGWDNHSQAMASEILKDKSYKKLFNKLKEAKEKIIQDKEIRLKKVK